MPSDPTPAFLWLRQVAALAAKDLRAEARSRENLVPMLVFALVVTAAFGFGLKGAAADLRPVFPGLLWVSVYFVGLFGLGRSFASEKAQDTLSGLRLVPAEGSFVFVGKLLANLFFVGVVELVAVPLMFAMLGVGLGGGLGSLASFVAVMVLGTVGFVSVGTLLAAMAAHTRAGEMLLPILVFPILVPSIVGSVGATSAILGLGDPASLPRWLGLLGAYDVLFVVVPWLVFDYLLEP